MFCLSLPLDYCFCRNPSVELWTLLPFCLDHSCEVNKNKNKEKKKKKKEKSKKNKSSLQRDLGVQVSSNLMGKEQRQSASALNTFGCKQSSRNHNFSLSLSLSLAITLCLFVSLALVTISSRFFFSLLIYHLPSSAKGCCLWFAIVNGRPASSKYSELAWQQHFDEEKQITIPDSADVSLLSNICNLA